ncbi:MAG TPA: M20/M25/M40 family metallo-hydrolase [Vicinamibacterales bacterium]|nr:M20/M25/M40 family metallo-hydrolase [Vicinamibacterales bacterium]
MAGACLAVTLFLSLRHTGLAEVSVEPVDTRAVEMIHREGLTRSHVMSTASHLTDVFGPRLTGSPLLQRAAEWCIERLQSWGINDARLEAWGTFGPGWVNERFVVHVLTPSPWPVVGVPKAWTRGTNGPVTAEVVYAPMTADGDFESWKGRLRGKVVLPIPAPTLEPLFDAPARRFGDADLQALARGERVRARREVTAAQTAFARRRLQFLTDEGALAILEASRSKTGAVLAQADGAFDTTALDGSQLLPAEGTPPQIVIAAEHYGRLARLRGLGVPVTMELDVRNRFLESRPGYNVIAELRGTDKADEIVMFGAHLDSWHGATGATDNAVGAAVAMEAMRILKATGLPLRRTVRLALWTGEEQGLLGSRAWVAAHVAERETMQLKPEHARLSVYFNVDHGAGAIRGVYLQENQAVAPIFTAWMSPFASIGMATLSPRGEHASDHVSFDEVGVPAFQFIQDPLEYDSRTHHTSSDTFERLQPMEAGRNAVILASFVYHAANRDERLPRKPLPASRVRTSAPRP